MERMCVCVKIIPLGFDHPCKAAAMSDVTLDRRQAKASMSHRTLARPFEDLSVPSIPTARPGLQPTSTATHRPSEKTRGWTLSLDERNNGPRILSHVGCHPKQERESTSAQLIGGTTRAVRTRLFDVPVNNLVLVEVVRAFSGICELG